MTAIVDTGVHEIDSLFDDPKMERNRLGNQVWDAFVMHMERYYFDEVLDSEVWDQFDTDQDASYFGIWVSKSKRAILCFAEGDVSFTQCASDEAYDAELAALCTFHTPAPFLKALGEDGWTHYYQDRAGLFIDAARGSAAQTTLGKVNEAEV